MEPAMSPDGRFLVFVSNRPADGIGPPLDGHFMGKSFPGGGGNLWRVERTAEGWGAPLRLPEAINADSSTFAPSVAADGSLWFMHPVDGGRHFRLYRAGWRDDHFEAPRPLPFSGGTSADVDPAVAPDESFVVFGSSRPPARDIDLFIAFRHGTTWGPPRHLGNVVNSPALTRKRGCRRTRARCTFPASAGRWQPRIAAKPGPTASTTSGGSIFPEC